MSSLMRAADLFVFPSRYEPYGLALLEAMASGLPVITTTAAGSADIVSAECGIVMDDPNNTGVLAVALKRLVQYPEKRKRMGQVARTVVEQYSWQQMTGRHLRLYEEILNHRRE